MKCSSECPQGERGTRKDSENTYIHVYVYVSLNKYVYHTLGRGPTVYQVVHV